MKRIIKYSILFTIGAITYATIELAWRGRTHWTMMIAGGICLVAFSVIEKRFSGAPLILKSAICAGFVTLTELVFGLIFNVLLGWEVWNYGKMPYNILGQICPTYTLLWWGLAFISLPLVKLSNKKISL